MTSLVRLAAVCLTVNRSIAAPVSSMMQTACSDHDQSTPAHLSGLSPSLVLLLLVVAGSGSFIAVVAPVIAGGRPRLGAAAGRSLKRSRRTTPSPVSTPRPAGPRVVKADLESHASLGDDPTVRDAHRTRRIRLIQLALSDVEPLQPCEAPGRGGGVKRPPPLPGRQDPAERGQGNELVLFTGCASMPHGSGELN